MSIWGRWARYRRTQRARMDEFRARDLGFGGPASRAEYDEPAASGDEAPEGPRAESESGLIASTLPFAPGPSGEGAARVAVGGHAGTRARRPRPRRQQAGQGQAP